jgi:hypothetical protein
VEGQTRAVKTYKFLDGNGLGPVSGFAWPLPRDATPGEWVDTEGALGICRRGAHVCRVTELPYWLHDALWEVEAGGDRLEGVDCLVVRRARLLREVVAWRSGAPAFAEECARHAETLVRASGAGGTALELALGLVADAFAGAAHGYVGASAYAAALAVSSLAPPAEQRARFRAERSWQAERLSAAFLAPGT